MSKRGGTDINLVKTNYDKDRFDSINNQFDTDIREKNRNTKSNKLTINKPQHPLNRGYDVKDYVKCSNDKLRFNKANSTHIKENIKDFNPNVKGIQPGKITSLVADVIEPK